MTYILKNYTFWHNSEWFENWS